METKSQFTNLLTIVTEVQHWYISNRRQADFKQLAASCAESISAQIQLDLFQHRVWRNTE